MKLGMRSSVLPCARSLSATVATGSFRLGASPPRGPTGQPQASSEGLARTRSPWAKRRKSRKIKTERIRAFAPTGPNQVWAYDFIHDRCADGPALNILTVIDEWMRERLAIEVASSINAARVISVLERVVSRFEAPQALRSDNGPKFIARAFRIWVS